MTDHDMPERIWAIYARTSTVYMSGNTPVMAQDGPFSHYGYGDAAEYLRRDGETVTAMVEALKRIEVADSDCIVGRAGCDFLDHLRNVNGTFMIRLEDGGMVQTRTYRRDELDLIDVEIRHPSGRVQMVKIFWPKEDQRPQAAAIRDSNA